MNPKKKTTKLILTPVKELPKRTYGAKTHDIIGTLETFMDMNCKIAKIELGIGDYANLNVAADAFQNVITRHGYPFKVSRRDGGLYLIKK